MAIGGDSAGGNLAAVAAQALRGSEPGFAGQLLIYPVTDFESERPSHEENAEGLFLTGDDMTWFRSLYVGDHDLADPRVSPLIAADLSGLPPAVVITAEFDPLRDDGEAYAEALEAAGVPVRKRRFDGLIHGSSPWERRARLPWRPPTRSAASFGNSSSESQKWCKGVTRSTV